MRGSAFLLLALLVGTAAPVAAAIDSDLLSCLQRAELSPDTTVMESEAWLKQGGGDKARLCHAFSMFHGQQHLFAAQEFAYLAKTQEKVDSLRAGALHAQAGLSYMRANDQQKSESEYAAALMFVPYDPEIWFDRAVGRAGAERYWDAVDDLKRALVLKPTMIEAVRLRAQIWTKLGLESKAKEDALRVLVLENAEKKQKSQP